MSSDALCRMVQSNSLSPESSVDSEGFCGGSPPNCTHSVSAFSSSLEQMNHERTLEFGQEALSIGTQDLCETAPWFALQTKPRAEESVALALYRKGFQQFLPIWRPSAVENKRKRRLQRSLPLFPGYVFCRVNLCNRHVLVIVTPGVLRFVGIGGRPCPVPDSEIEALMRVSDSQVSIEPSELYVVGQAVKIIHGPLTGVAGVVTHVGEKRKFSIQMSVLQRSVTVKVPMEWLAAEQDQHTHTIQGLAAAGQLGIFKPCQDASMVLDL